MFNSKINSLFYRIIQCRPVFYTSFLCSLIMYSKSLNMGPGAGEFWCESFTLLSVINATCLFFWVMCHWGIAAVFWNWGMKWERGPGKWLQPWERVGLSLMEARHRCCAVSAPTPGTDATRTRNVAPQLWPCVTLTVWLADSFINRLFGCMLSVCPSKTFHILH